LETGSSNKLGIPIGTNCAPPLADLFLHSYEAELLRKGEKKLAQSFSYTFRYKDDVLSLNNKKTSATFYTKYIQ